MGRELPRRLVHAGGSVIPGSYLLEILTWQQVRYLLVAGIVLAIVIETARLTTNWELPLVNRLIRSYEEQYVAGYALYIFAGGGVGLVFEPAIAVPAMLMLTLGDPIAGLLSKGELRRVKRPHVLVVMFIVCLIFAWWTLPPRAAIAAALVATLADGAKPIIRGYVVDDNLTIPVGAALAAYLMREFVPPLV